MARAKEKNLIDPGRMAAYNALVKIDSSNAYSNIELNAVLNQKNKTRKEKGMKSGKVIYNPGFVRELTYGVVRNKKYLDYYIDRLARDGIKSVEIEIKVLLRMGIYQIVFMDSVPDHAAVDETVKIAKLLLPWRDRFVNALLRSFIRLRDSDYGKPDETSKNTFFTGPLSEKNIPIPDIKDDIRLTSVMYSCDEGLIKILASQYGLDKTREFLEVSLETPPLYIRVNTIRTSAEDLEESLKAQGFDVSGYSTDTLIVSGSGILETQDFLDGKFFVQDASSTEAVKAFDPQPGETLIDVCAAPGGKTFSAACLMENRGTIHAMDLHGNKLKALEKQAKRLGITIIDTEEHNAKTVNEKYADGQADKVLCDVPCSGLGVLRRKPEIKGRPLKNEGKDIAEIQYQILAASAEYVRPGGMLMYSTCTINRIENDDVTDRFLTEHSDFSMESKDLTLPCTGGPDGFYYCIMKRCGDAIA